MHKVCASIGPFCWINKKYYGLEGNCMFSFQTFKDIRYWILLPPFIVIFLGISVFAPNYFVENPIMILILSLLNGVLFWVTYHSWKYIGDKNTEIIKVLSSVIGGDCLIGDRSISQSGQRDKFCDKCLRHENTGNLL